MNSYRKKANLLIACLFATTTGYSYENIQEIKISAEFHDDPLLEVPNSISVIGSETIGSRNATHLEQLLAVAPNLNYSSGASRGRFFQIRGIGERSQFVDPVNPSVGLIVDGVDFTGMGLAASTLDVEQVEIFRGPQGTLFGANALSGLININSKAPSKDFTGQFGGELADYDGRLLSAVVSGPVTENLGYRFAVQQQQSDGFIENDFLNREDTSDIDEQFIRGKLRFAPDDELTLDFNVFYVNADNGYDDFSLLNNRHTTSDQPGTDAQESIAGSIVGQWRGLDKVAVEFTLSGLDANLEYGYDEDWSYINEFSPSQFPYSSADQYQRDRSNGVIDLRLLSKEDRGLFNGHSAWVIGVYLRTEEEDLQRIRFDSLSQVSQFDNAFDTENRAIYGQLDTQLNGGWSLITGLRFENRQADYRDSAGVSRDSDKDLWGGRIALNKQLDEAIMIYGLISRGYKAGGVNGQIISAALTNPSITSDVYFFNTETLLNYEIGLKGAFLEGGLQLQLAAFYQERKDAQAKQSIFNPADFSFDDYLTNAEGVSSGLELEFSYQASEALLLFGSLGLLESEFVDFISAAHVDARDDWNGIPLAPVDLDGREVAHAPNYQFYLGGEFSFSENIYVRLEAEGKDAFYFSNSHDQKSDSYELIHARLGYRTASWELVLWGRNLTDEDVEVRGFYFSNQYGNNPGNDYAPETYVQYGEPRVIGLSGIYNF